MPTPEDTPFPTSQIMSEGAELNEAGLPRSDTSMSQPSAMGDRRSSEDVFARVVQGAHETIDRLADTAAPHVHRWSESVSSGTGHLRETGEEWTESLRTTVRENPLAAVATAVAVGLLIARLTR